MTKKPKLDKVDRKIISLLRENSRITISDVSREITDLTESAIRYRLERLEKEGFIKNYTIVLNSTKFNKKFPVIFNLKVLPEDVQKAIEYLKKIDSLSHVYLTTGTYSVVAIGYFSNPKEITDFIMDRLKDVPMVDYDIAQILRKEKDVHQWS